MTSFYLSIQFQFKALLLFALGLSSSILVSAEDNSAGCLILQTNNTQKLRVENNAVGQTMVPCTGGSLDYMTFFVESTSDETFTAQLRVWDHATLLTKQQMVIPSIGHNEAIVWFVEPPLVTEGKEYTIEIEAPSGKSFFAYYSEQDLYGEGNMRINDLLTSGDLAFEAGIRLTKKQKKDLFSIKVKNTCNPLQNLAEGSISANNVAQQSFQLCEDYFVQGLTLQYQSSESQLGMCYIYEVADVSGAALLGAPFEISAANPMTPIYIPFPEGFSLQADTEYAFKLITPSGAPFTETFALFMTEESNYASGSLVTTDAQAGEDLTFELHLGDPTEFNEEVQYLVFEAYPDHDCSISQPYASQKEVLPSGLIEFDLKICDDGALEAIYFMGTQSTTGGPIQFELKDERNQTIHSGSLEQLDGYDQTLAANMGSTSVFYYLNYTLTLTIPDGSELQLYSSTNEKHAHFDCRINGEALASNLVMVNAMKPYVVEFLQANEDQQDLRLVAYPNPFISDFTLEVEGVKTGTAKASLYDFQGNLVFEEVLEGSIEPITVKVIPEIALQRGYYTLRIDYKDQVLLETVMKQ